MVSRTGPFVNVIEGLRTLFKILKQGRFRSRPRVGHAYA